MVEFCERKGIRMHGHTIIYGQPAWGPPDWWPAERKAMEPVFEKHIKELAERYGARLESWDVVNEPIDQANRRIMPDDYTFKSYAWAHRYFPAAVKLNINDCDLHYGVGGVRRYAEIVRNLIDRGARVDTVGIQMHIFNPKETSAIAAGGATPLVPERMLELLEALRDTGRPIHVSEVTVSAVDDTPTGRAIQAEVTRNLYRLWFSVADVMGITWWNVVDGGAAPGEPSFSGLFTKEMEPKPSYHALDKLINQEWKTNLKVKADADGRVAFRGFRGKYQLTWQDGDGAERQSEVLVE